ncbi:uncharacterized protein C2845_PM11G30820 [Panicum miliaceum]|uniref:Uncharacterized protein n=1 Tax=Panicum miliaceum TaxID=4540 RepID=A0A3L6RVZ3_PANMI|nr:uncharacterized protein C2845_PM11G30820 [Panicum miliaceum]
MCPATAACQGTAGPDGAGRVGPEGAFSSSLAAAPRLPLLPRRRSLVVTVASPPRLLPAGPRASTSASDLSPTPPSERTMTALDLASLWAELVVGVPAYYLAGSLVDLGMSALQGVATVTFANLIVLVTLVLTAARAAFGVHGAHVPAVIRALVGCGWFGIGSWIGGPSSSCPPGSSRTNR